MGAKSHEAWRSNTTGSGGVGKFSNTNKHRGLCLCSGTIQWLAVSSGSRDRLSYLCQVGVDPFCECPFLHGLLLICKSEAHSVSRMQKKPKKPKLNNAQSFHCLLSSEPIWSARLQSAGNLPLMLFCNAHEDRHGK